MTLIPELALRHAQGHLPSHPSHESCGFPSHTAACGQAGMRKGLMVMLKWWIENKGTISGTIRSTHLRPQVMLERPKQVLFMQHLHPWEQNHHRNVSLEA